MFETISTRNRVLKTSFLLCKSEHLQTTLKNKKKKREQFPKGGNHQSQGSQNPYNERDIIIFYCGLDLIENLGFVYFIFLVGKYFYKKINIFCLKLIFLMY
jgi:hypothetical protein